MQTAVCTFLWKRKCAPPFRTADGMSASSSVEIVSLFEFVDASACIDKFLFAREVRMALGANFNSEFAYVFGGTRLECVATSAHNSHVMVLWMDSFFHFCSPDSFFYTHTRQYLTRI